MSKEYESIKSDPHLILDVHSEDVLLNRKDKELILDKHRKIKSRAKKLLSNFSSNNYLEREIFLLLRMLFLRFSHDAVMQMIRDLLLRCNRSP
jgi:hypothetical protein